MQKIKIVFATIIVCKELAIRKPANALYGQFAKRQVRINSFCTGYCCASATLGVGAPGGGGYFTLGKTGMCASFG